MYDKSLDSLRLVEERETVFKYIILELILLALGLIFIFTSVCISHSILMTFGGACIMLFVILFLFFCINF